MHARVGDGPSSTSPQLHDRHRRSSLPCADSKCATGVAPGVSPVRPERCWPLAVGVVRWTGTPRRRCGRGGGPELPYPPCVVLG